MVVDDDRDVTQAIVQALSGMEKEFDFQTIPCFDGLDAQEAFDRLLPEVVILDLMLPKRGGFQLLKRWKIDGKNKGKLPIVIMITGNEGPRHQAYAEQLGVDDYIRKPFSMGALTASLRQFLERMPDLLWVERYREAAEELGRPEVQETDPTPGIFSGLKTEQNKRRLRKALQIIVFALILALAILFLAKSIGR